jgi:hypothetical protein
MKAIHLWVGAALCVYGASSHAAGDRTQGTNVCGAGLEILDSKGHSTGNCLAVRAGSLPNGPLKLNDTQSSEIRIANPSKCTPTAAYWSCTDASFVSLGVKGEQFCAVAPGTPVRLIFLRAKLVNGGFQFNLTGSDLVVVCGGGQFAAPPSPGRCDLPPEPYSTADDCIWWGYAPTSDAKERRRFNACVRMARADYLGNGTSGTRLGIHIQPYTGSGGDQAECRANAAACNGCFEASWDETGATCIAHYRVKEVVRRLVEFAGYDLDTAKKLFEQRFGDPERGDPKPGDKKPGDKKLGDAKSVADDSLVCILKGDAKTLASALLLNRSRIHQCAAPPPPNPTMSITNCHTTGPDPACPPVPGPCP